MRLLVILMIIWFGVSEQGADKYKSRSQFLDRGRVQ
jgi:hypothetical protein